MALEMSEGLLIKDTEIPKETIFSALCSSATREKCDWPDDNADIKEAWYLLLQWK